MFIDLSLASKNTGDASEPQYGVNAGRIHALSSRCTLLVLDKNRSSLVVCLA